MPKSSLSIVKAHRHLLLSVKTFVCSSDDNLEVYFSLFDGDGEKFLRYYFFINSGLEWSESVSIYSGLRETTTCMGQTRQPESFPI
jgi:hypothetical protein